MDHFVATAFEEAAITFTWRLAQAGELDFVPERIGGWWNRDAEIDVLAINLFEKIAFVGECKWTVHPVGASVLDELKQKAGAMMKDYEIKKVQFALFSRSGFTSELEDQSMRGDLALFTVDSLVNRV